MKRILIVADDLTGANANCALLKKNGLNAASLIYPETEVGEKTDVLAFSTNSRGLSPRDAYLTVRSAISKFKKNEILFYNKRIDSTLRGNVGAEIEAFLDEFPEKTMILVPSFPDSGRVSVNGVLLVNGKLLEFSDASKDPKNPIHTSDIRKIITSQTQYPIFSFTLSDISLGKDHLKKRLSSMAGEYRIFLFDAFTNQDIQTIAEALSELPLEIITGDPGPLTMYYSLAVLKKNRAEKKTLFTIGSAVPIVKQQIEELIISENIFLIKANPLAFYDPIQSREEKKRILDEIELGIRHYDYIMVTSSPIGQDEPLNLFTIAKEYKISMDEASSVISNSLAEISSNILNSYHTFNTVISCGGDITIALLHNLGAVGIDIREELFPLVAYGKIIGGAAPGLNIVSKGGMAGDRYILKKCLEKINNYN